MTHKGKDDNEQIWRYTKLIVWHLSGHPPWWGVPVCVAYFNPFIACIRDGESDEEDVDSRSLNPPNGAYSSSPRNYGQGEVKRNLLKKEWCAWEEWWIIISRGTSS